MPRRLGERRNVPEKLIDSWTYKVKDVDLEKLEYVPLTGEEAEDIKLGSGRDERSFDEKYHRVKEKVRNKVVTVNVYMVKTTEQSEEPPHPLRTVGIIIKVPELGIKIEGTDVAAMKDAVWSMLDKKFEIQWERYYRVQVRKCRVYDGDGTGMEISYDDVYKGTTWDGKNLLKRWRGHEFRIEPWPGAFKDEQGKVMACIEATDANRAALEEFCRRVDVLRDKLAEFLRPDVIQQNLAALAGCALLPPAPPETEVKNSVDAQPIAD